MHDILRTTKTILFYPTCRNAVSFFCKQNTSHRAHFGSSALPKKCLHLSCPKSDTLKSNVVLSRRACVAEID